MPSSVASPSGTRATTWEPSGDSESDAPSRSRDFKLTPLAVFGQVASPAAEVRLFCGIVILNEDGPASTDGPCVSFANIVNGPFFDASVMFGAASRLLLSM